MLGNIADILPEHNTQLCLMTCCDSFNSMVDCRYELFKVQHNFS